MNKLALALSTIAIIIGMSAIMMSSKNEKIGYINSAQLIEEYSGTASARATYDQKTKLWKTNIDTLRAEFEKDVQEYEKEKNGMSKKEQQLNEELLQSKQQQFLQYQEAIQQKAQEEDKKIMGEILAKINATVKTYGEKNGFKVILGANGSGNIAYGSEAWDLTDELIKELNQ